MLTLYKIRQLKEQIAHLEKELTKHPSEEIIRKKTDKFIKSFGLDINEELKTQIVDIDFLTETISKNSENKETYYLIKFVDYYLYINQTTERFSSDNNYIIHLIKKNILSPDDINSLINDEYYDNDIKFTYDSNGPCDANKPFCTEVKSYNKIPSKNTLIKKIIYNIVFKYNDYVKVIDMNKLKTIS
jgi:predicted RNase H-like nuclease (RuvC/YqgF family)